MSSIFIQTSILNTYNWGKFLKNQMWLVYALSVFVIAVGLTYGVHTLYRKLTNKCNDKDLLLAKILMKALYGPLLIFIWVAAIHIHSYLSIPYIDAAVLQVIDKMRKITLLILLAWLFIRFIKLFEDQLLEGRFRHQAKDKTAIQATGKILRVAAFLIVVLLLLPMLGIELTGIWALVGGSAFGVGFAAKRLISNYLGGIVVHSDGNFKVGDWIYSPDKEIEGIVEYIGWLSTHIRTFDRRMLYVPNNTFSNIVIINASRMTHRRIKHMINISYTDTSILNKVLEGINIMLQNHPDLDKTRRLAAHFAAFGPFSVKIRIYAFTRKIVWEDFQNVQQDVFLKILDVISENGAEIAICPYISEPQDNKGE